MKRDGFAMAGVLLVVLVLAVIGGIGYAHYVYLPKMTAQSNVTSTVAATSTTASPMIPVATSTTTTQHVTAVVTSSVVKISVGADVQTTVSCGTQDCFNKDFTSCTPATLTSDASGVGAVSYKIIGPVSGGCKMTFVYTANPNPAWVNQPMTCTYDNTIDFQTSIQNTFEAAVEGKSNCTGPLVSILKGLTSSTADSQNTAGSVTAAPSGVGTVTEYLSTGEDSTGNGIGFKVNSLTSSQLNVTVTNSTTGQSQTVTLSVNDPTMVLGYDMEVTNIQQVSYGTVNGQPTYNEQATLTYNN